MHPPFHQLIVSPMCTFLEIFTIESERMTLNDHRIAFNCLD